MFLLLPLDFLLTHPFWPPTYPTPPLLLLFLVPYLLIFLLLSTLPPCLIITCLVTSSSAPPSSPASSYSSPSLKSSPFFSLPHSRLSLFVDSERLDPRTVGCKDTKQTDSQFAQCKNRITASVLCRMCGGGILHVMSS